MKQIIRRGIEDRKDGGDMRSIDVGSDRYLAAVLGFVVGDALGVPVEFKSRANMKDNPVTDMCGYGTHNQPAGTWSDDSSMVIATMEWLSEMTDKQPNYAHLMDKFSAWLMYGDYTPYGEVFDCGISISRAIINYGRGVEPLMCGGRAEWENGNGSVMRILPVALWSYEELITEDLPAADFIFNLSSLTHAHMRSKMGCLIYAKLIADLILYEGKGKHKIVEKCLSECRRYFDSADDEEVISEKDKYDRMWDVSAFQNLEEDSIRSSGYVVDTLEAAIWCFLNTDNYKDCVLMAVNLGEDTDTIGAVAGGLAGLYYGLEAIPEKWINVIPKKDWIIELVEQQRKNKYE